VKTGVIYNGLTVIAIIGGAMFGTAVLVSLVVCVGKSIIFCANGL